MKIVIFATAVYTDTLTGGDKIFVECAKRWIAAGHDVHIVTNEAGDKYCEDNGIPKNCIILWPTSKSDSLGVYIAMLVKAWTSLWRAFAFATTKADIIFASSFFAPDMIPAFFMKLVHPKSKLAVACYLFTTRPFGSDYSGGKLKGFLFYLNELFAFGIMHIFGNALFTASAYDRLAFLRTQKFPEDRVMAVRGGVDSAVFALKEKPNVAYDAVFVGRLHPQKCVDALIRMWAEVVHRDPGRTLAIVGSGPMKQELVSLTKRLDLEKHVLFLGPKDGKEKIDILHASGIFISASLYDSGNIALDEGLAAGLPGVVYDLPRLDYPKGVIKVPPGNEKEFVNAIHTVFAYKNLYERLSHDAQAFAKTIDWDIKAEEILEFIKRS